MNIVQWNPWRDFDDLFARAANASSEGLARADWVPAVNISETDAAYEIEMDLPAVPTEHVSVAVEDGVLTVSGERRDDSESTDGANGTRRHRVERRYGRFVRSFRLPENVDEEAIEARSKHGVLHLTVAKKDEPTPRTIEIQVH